MLFILLSAFCLSEKDQCPPGTEYFFDQEIEKQIPESGWYYFYTSHQLRKKPLVYAIRSEKPITLYLNQHSSCPDEKDPPHAQIPGDNVLTRVNIPVESELKIVVNGVKGTPGSYFKLSLEGQHKKKKKFPIGLKLTLIFFGMLTVTLIYFCYCVIPPKKEKVE
ncbi:hypothetical protein M9Y10_034818 [Tritrichomonas musculus]|uniref:Uncharacterized protein n=1 Tax=Tritrichomonas musculus TaxID=1915356 RepID=A0ABR2KG56_9EUKA